MVRESYSYYEAGRQSKRQLAGAPQQTLTWDSEGELQTVTAGSSAASFVYDGNGDRLTRTDSSGTTVYLPGGQEILVTADGVKSATRYHGFDGQTVAVRDTSGLGGVTSLVVTLTARRWPRSRTPGGRRTASSSSTPTRSVRRVARRRASRATVSSSTRPVTPPPV